MTNLSRLLLILVLSGLWAAFFTYGVRVGMRGEPAVEQPRRVAADIETFSLRNGMEVVLVRNDRVPAISHTLWVRAGAADDPPGQSGLAHYLEHLLFKGTPTHPEGVYEATISGLGGELNAFTGADYTGYYVNIAREHLETVMRLESDRLQHIAPSAEAYGRELQVILEERRSRVENRPAALLDEQMRAMLFRHHPYRIPIIGWMHEMERLIPQDTLSFRRRFYHPGMMVLVVAGDITAAELQPLAERYYGTIPAHARVARDWLAEPPQRAPRRVSLTHSQVEQPRLSRLYEAPRYGDASGHALPLEIFSHWLGGGRTGLLYRELVVERQLATSAGSYYSGLVRGPGIFAVYATPAPGVGLNDLEAAMDAVIARARTETIDQSSLARAKTLLKAETIFARDGLANLAQIAGTLRMLDLDFSYLTDWDTLVEAVSAEAVRAAAQAALQPERSVTGSLLPEGETHHVTQ